MLQQAGQGDAPARVDGCSTSTTQQLAQLGARGRDARGARSSTTLRAELAAAFAAITRTERRGERALRVEDRRARRVDAIATHAARARARRPRDRSRRRSARIATTSRSSSTAATPAAFASQGQLRAIMLAWKTAELALLARAHGEPPILLLDDVSSELDPSAQRVPVRAPREAGRPVLHHDHRTERMSCSPAIGPITASKTARFPREIRHMIPFLAPRECAIHSSSAQRRPEWQIPLRTSQTSETPYDDSSIGVLEGPRRRPQAPRHVHRRHR